MNPDFLKKFPGQLGHWTLHGIFNALPSFIIALTLLGYMTKPIPILAMLMAIAVYIVLFATLTSLPGPFSEETHVLRRAVRLGAQIRSWIAGISLVLLPGGFNTLVFMPDFWCGWAALMIGNQGFQWLGFTKSPAAASSGELLSDGFLPVFATTMIEGFIISFLLLMVSFFCVIFLQGRDRRKFNASQRAKTPGI
jgi:hypothetical protein